MATCADIKEYEKCLKIANLCGLEIIFNENDSFGVIRDDDNLGNCFSITNLWSYLCGYLEAVNMYEEDEEDVDKEYMVVDMESLTVILDNEKQAMIFENKKQAMKYACHLTTDFKIIEL